MSVIKSSVFQSIAPLSLTNFSFLSRGKYLFAHFLFEMFSFRARNIPRMCIYEKSLSVCDFSQRHVHGMLRTGSVDGEEQPLNCKLLACPQFARFNYRGDIPRGLRPLSILPAEITAVAKRSVRQEITKRMWSRGWERTVEYWPGSILRGNWIANEKRMGINK